MTTEKWLGQTYPLHTCKEFDTEAGNVLRFLQRRKRLRRILAFCLHKKIIDKLKKATTAS